jgi:selenocysteine-specific elongation factor
VVLFVVAADEGWMPQSEEHLAVVDLLDIDRGVVALTKTDRITADLLDLATAEVVEHLAGTGLEGAPIVPVSAVEGRGLGDIESALDRLLPEPRPGDDPRVWVDRRFTIEGTGTVVTGTLTGGPLSRGAELVVMPGGGTVRIRGLESHEAPMERVESGRRVAINLAGAPDDLGRGHMLGVPDRWRVTSRFTARLRPARYVEEVTERGAYHLHVGSAATPVRIRPAGDGYLVVSDLALPLRHGDRFVLRDTGRRAVVAGGVVLDPDPPLRGPALRRSGSMAFAPSSTEAARALLDMRGSDDVNRLRAHTGASTDPGVVVGTTAITTDSLTRLARRLVDEVDRFHHETPLRPGIPSATLASRLAVTLDLVDHVVRTADELEVAQGVVRRRGRAVSLSPADQEAWDRGRKTLEEAGLLAPRVGDLPLSTELVHQLVRSGALVRISSDLVYLPETVERLRSIVAGMPDGFTVAQFRDAAGLTRKYAVPILEWSDAQSLTVRRGDLRHPRREGRDA